MIKSKGFSLIEILLVFATVAGLSSLAFYMFNKYQDQALAKQEVDNILYVIAETRGLFPSGFKCGSIHSSIWNGSGQYFVRNSPNASMIPKSWFNPQGKIRNAFGKFVRVNPVILQYVSSATHGSYITSALDAYPCTLLSTADDNTPATGIAIHYTPPRGTDNYGDDNLGIEMTFSQCKYMAEALASTTDGVMMRGARPGGFSAPLNSVYRQNIDSACTAWVNKQTAAPLFIIYAKI